MSFFYPVDQLTYVWDPSQLVGITSWTDFWPVYGQIASQAILTEVVNVAIAIAPLAGFFMKYYVIEKDPYSGTDWNNVADNVPFGSELVQGERNKDSYLVYRNTDIGDATTSMVGHAVDSTYLYKAGTGSYVNEDTFYTNGGGHSTTSDYEIIRNEGLYLNGAIIKNDDVSALQDSGFSVNEGLPNYSTVSGMQPVSCLGKKITTDYGYFTNEEGPAAFLVNSKRVTATEDFNPSTYYNPLMTYLSDFDKVVFYPKSGWGQAFNTDPNGAYFLMAKTLSMPKPRAPPW